MSAGAASDVDLLRRAAAAMRKEKAIEENLGHIDGHDYKTWLAVADWLDSMVGAMTSPDVDIPHAGRTTTNVDEAAAHTVARAYLGEGSEDAS